MATLYRKYRPQTFKDVSGQDHVVLTLQRALVAGRVGHAYLFCGPRGVGKTTIARILAKAVNCTSQGEKPCGKCKNCEAIANGNFVDLIEIDAASNRGIDEIRELRDKIKFSPSVGSKKVYIIDEVHMLTREAFNALLKTLEEPPAHSIFIFATTEINKVPETVISRCQRFDFHLATSDLIEKSIKGIAKAEKLNVSEGVAKVLAKASGGSFRDAQSLLDQLSSHLAKEDITAEQAEGFLNLSSVGQVNELISLFRSADSVRTLNYIASLKEKGTDFEQLLTNLTGEIRNTLINTILSGEAGAWEQKALSRLIEAAAQAKNSPIDCLPLELAALDICTIGQNKTPSVDTSSKDQPADKNTKSQKSNIKPNDQDQVISDGKKIEVKNDSIVLREEIVGSKAAEKKTVIKQALSHQELSNLSFDCERKAAIVETVGLKNKPLSSLLGSSQWQYDGNELTIYVEYALYKDKINALKNRLILEEAISEVMGALPRITCKIANSENIKSEIESVFDVSDS